MEEKDRKEGRGGGKKLGIHNRAKDSGKISKRGQAREIFADHVEVRGRWFERRNGRRPASPQMGPKLEKVIVAAIEAHGYDHARAAGRGVFLDRWHTGGNEEGRLVLDPPLVWRMNAQTDNVDRFARLYLDHMAKKGKALPWKGGYCEPPR